MATAAIKPSAEFAYKLCRGGAAKTEGQWLIAKKNCQLTFFLLSLWQQTRGRVKLPTGGDSPRLPKATPIAVGMTQQKAQGD